MFGYPRRERLLELIGRRGTVVFHWPNLTRSARKMYVLNLFGQSKLKSITFTRRLSLNEATLWLELRFNRLIKDRQTSQKKRIELDTSGMMSDSSRLGFTYPLKPKERCLSLPLVYSWHRILTFVGLWTTVKTLYTPYIPINLFGFSGIIS